MCDSIRVRTGEQKRHTPFSMLFLFHTHTLTLAHTNSTHTSLRTGIPHAACTCKTLACIRYFHTVSHEQKEWEWEKGVGGKRMGQCRKSGVGWAFHIGIVCHRHVLWHYVKTEKLPQNLTIQKLQQHYFSILPEIINYGILSTFASFAFIPPFILKFLNK